MPNFDPYTIVHMEKNDPKIKEKRTRYNDRFRITIMQILLKVKL